MQNDKMLERRKMILAMEYICRNINDEDVFMHWLTVGVPDGDVPYGSFDTAIIDEDDCMMQDDGFRDLMKCFLECMQLAAKDGGLYCGDVVAEVKR